MIAISKYTNPILTCHFPLWSFIKDVNLRINNLNLTDKMEAVPEQINRSKKTEGDVYHLESFLNQFWNCNHPVGLVPQKTSKFNINPQGSGYLVRENLELQHAFRGGICSLWTQSLTPSAAAWRILFHGWMELLPVSKNIHCTKLSHQATCPRAWLLEPSVAWGPSGKKSEVWINGIPSGNQT